MHKLVLLVLLFFTFATSYAQFKFEDLKIDTTITGFHYAADFQGTKVFTKHGPSDIQTINPTAFSFTVGKNMSALTAAMELGRMHARAKSDGFDISDFKEIDTTVTGHKVYGMSYIETDKESNYKNIVFNALIVVGSDVIVFTSGDLDNGIFADKFQQTFYSLTF